MRSRARVSAARQALPRERYAPSWNRQAEISVTTVRRVVAVTGFVTAGCGQHSGSSTPLPLRAVVEIERGTRRAMHEVAPRRSQAYAASGSKLGASIAVIPPKLLYEGSIFPAWWPGRGHRPNKGRKMVKKLLVGALAAGAVTVSLAGVAWAEPAADPGSNGVGAGGIPRVIGNNLGSEEPISPGSQFSEIAQQPGVSVPDAISAAFPILTGLQGEL